MDKGNSREILLDIIEKNPGLHFRELQRRSGLAIGQLEYHLYRMERDKTIVSRRDGRLLRYFSNVSGNIIERNLAFYLRSRNSRILIMELIRNKGKLTLLWNSDDKRRETLESMTADSIVSCEDQGNKITVEFTDYKQIINFLVQNREKFLDSLASSLINLLDKN